MNIEAMLAPFVGRMVEARIEDVDGSDPLAPPRTFRLYRVQLVPGGSHVKCYLNETQYLSVPVIDDERTKLIAEGGQGTRFVSEDREANLIYSLTIRPASKL